MKGEHLVVGVGVHDGGTDLVELKPDQEREQSIAIRNLSAAFKKQRQRPDDQQSDHDYRP